MIFYFYQQGKILYNVSESVHQGSNKANSLYCAIPASINDLVSVAFSLPDGTSTRKYLMTLDTTTQINNPYSSGNVTYHIWYFAIPIEVTQNYGTVGIQFYISDAEENTLATGASKFVIDKGVAPGEIPEDDYEDIMEILASFSNSIDNMMGNLGQIQAINLHNGTGVNSLQQSGCNANHKNSVALGLSTNTQASEQVAIGKYNSSVSNALFIVGNGSSSNRQNAFVVTSDGRATVQTAPTQATHVANKKYVDDSISSAMSSVYIYKGSVTNFSDLPSSNLKVGYVYNVVNACNDFPAGTNYAWNGTAWDALGGYFNLSSLANASDLPTVVFLGE